jgi:phage shock protein A
MRNRFGGLVVASATVGLGTFLSQASAQSDDLKGKVQELEQQLKILQRQIELQNEASAEKAKSTPVISAGASGFSFRSADSNFVLPARLCAGRQPLVHR